MRNFADERRNQVSQHCLYIFKVKTMNSFQIPRRSSWRAQGSKREETANREVQGSSPRERGQTRGHWTESQKVSEHHRKCKALDRLFWCWNQYICEDPWLPWISRYLDVAAERRGDWRTWLVSSWTHLYSHVALWATQKEGLEVCRVAELRWTSPSLRSSALFPLWTSWKHVRWSL